MTGCIGFKDFSHFVLAVGLELNIVKDLESAERELKVKNKESNISVTGLFPEDIIFSLLKRRER